jgi:hypothetical protein
MFVNVDAVVLSAEKRGETDKRLSIYTRQKGRLTALAVGARRPGARLASATEPCVEAAYRLWMGRDAASARVTGGMATGTFPGLRKNWSRMNEALFLCEWTERMTPLVEPQPAKYELLTRALSALESADEATVRRAFLVQFMELAGYRVGGEILGPGLEARARPFIDALHAHDFSPEAPAPGGGELGPAVETRILAYAAPLMNGPLKTLEHRRSLEAFMARASEKAGER